MPICKEYSKLLEEATSKKKQLRLFFDKLKKYKNEKAVNQLFHEHHVEVFEEIDCLKCAHCCSTVGPRITYNDIDKIAVELGKKPSEVTETYLKIDSDKDFVFKSMPCPFLSNNDHTCSVYSARPKACREYPHTDHKKMKNILPVTYKNAFICPAVFLIVKKVEEDLK